MIKNAIIIGTGLIGASVGLAIHEYVSDVVVVGADREPGERQIAMKKYAIDEEAVEQHSIARAVQAADLIVLAVPVMGILDWLQRLAPVIKPHQLVTDVGSTKRKIAEMSATLYNGPGQGRFLPGHPMAGKEIGGAVLAEAQLFDRAAWLFTPIAELTMIETEWRSMVAEFGCHIRDLDPGHHDKVCAWVSHLPQMLATALAALLEDEISANPEAADDFRAIGGRALREMTRLGASPYSMWRDVALTNNDPVAATLFALEQRLAHLRENLRTPELREEFQKANGFGARIR